MWKRSQKRIWLRGTLYNCSWFLELLCIPLWEWHLQEGIVQCTTMKLSTGAMPVMVRDHKEFGMTGGRVGRVKKQKKADPQLEQHNRLRFCQRLTLKLSSPTRWGIVQASSSGIPQPSEPTGLPLNWGWGETQARKEKCWAHSSLSCYMTLISTNWGTNALSFLYLGLLFLPTASAHSSAWETQMGSCAPPASPLGSYYRLTGGGF